MGYRTEHDSLGTMQVPEERFWGAQTQRCLNNFKIGTEKMPQEIIKAFAYLKKAAALSNHALKPDRMTEEKTRAIASVCDEILSGALDNEFPLPVWQTGSGTHTNMNVNEVIAGRANALAGKALLHPNDDVNMSQSSNDTFPTAMHIAAVMSINERLLPALDALEASLLRLEKENESVIKAGRTHLQDAVPIRFSQEISGWRSMLASGKAQLKRSMEALLLLAMGGTAVGTGLNAPKGYVEGFIRELRTLTEIDFSASENFYRSLTSQSALVCAHGVIKAVACDLIKIANDIRWLSSGPRCGLGEITIPANEPGSSIMPGKVNPTQCEALIMAAIRVIGNDTVISLSATQGNFELNVCQPVCAYSFLQSVRILSDAALSFEEHCVRGIAANRQQMAFYLSRSLMSVTSLSPVIGYEQAAKIVQTAQRENLTLKEACLKFGLLTEEDFDRITNPENMV